ncbi:MAG: D-alanyl-D-alanine carboxypeptidase/D-alanyl-D-alanine-endopeptidase [Pseudobdellovibrionaceae bacterium]|nr:D-alanyl-D-alanine carboxypeptidase/D-alanyl-D-alanine-endopeptidase [Pseudobdellovibrionaceae bacterium]
MRLPSISGLLLIAVFGTGVAKPASSLTNMNGNVESILVQRLSDGKVVYSSGPERALTPASVTKVITSAALLHYFGPAHTFKTRFYYSGMRSGEMIQGNLYVKGDGDPLVISEKLWQLAADLRHLGVKSFSGDLIIDNDLFDNEKRDSSRQDGVTSSDRAYDAPVSAFGLNFNTLPIAVSPGNDPGMKGRVEFDPFPIPNLPLVNNTNTTSGSKSSIQAVRQSRGNQSSLVVSGTIGTQAPMVKVYRSMGDAVEEGGEQLRSFLTASGIMIHGKVKEGSTPVSARLLYTLESYDLGFIVRGLNHYSNNFIADMLVKRLGAAFPERGAPNSDGSGTLRNGVQAIERFLRDEVGIKDKFEIINGSGLDNRNRFSAEQIVKVLVYMQRNMQLYPEFLASFPSSGLTGTLEKRFKNLGGGDIQGLVRAKTGTLSQPVSVSSLAGYMGHPKHGMLAFAILNNGQSPSNQPTVAEFRKRQDQALYEILEKY